jgi:hypothetical protein
MHIAKRIGHGAERSARGVRGHGLGAMPHAPCAMRCFPGGSA